MNNQIVTTGIVLARTDFGEADRILTILTPDQGKIRVMAKGVRRPRSKLAGGIELFSVSQITFMRGRGDIGTLVSSRLQKYYSNIVKDINRTMLGYELIKRMNKLTEDAADSDYFDVINASLAGLDNDKLSAELAELWFTMQILKIMGHSPSLINDHSGDRLLADEQYLFDFDAMALRQQANGPYDSGHIKLLRLSHVSSEPGVLAKVGGAEAYVAELLKLTTSIYRLHVHSGA